jgi:hypothetical protein
MSTTANASKYKSAKILTVTKDQISQIQDYLLQRDGIVYAQARLLHIAVRNLKNGLKNEANKDGDK